MGLIKNELTYYITRICWLIEIILAKYLNYPSKLILYKKYKVKFYTLINNSDKFLVY